MRNAARFALSLLFPLVTGLAGVLVVGNIGPWYRDLIKPPLTPPNWLFGPAWTVIYLLSGLSFYIVWQNKTGRMSKTPVYFLYIFQYFLNFFWTFLFFGLHNLIFSSVEIIIFWITVFVLIRKVSRISVRSACLLIPYIIWLSFALYLTLEIAVLNP